jgi:hypothetical protein
MHSGMACVAYSFSILHADELFGTVRTHGGGAGGDDVTEIRVELKGMVQGGMSDDYKET